MNESRKRGFVSTPPQPAYNAAPFELADLHAIHALVRCEASADQQRRFIAWFNRATGVAENQYRPGGEDGRRETDFALGKKFVGDQFYSIAKSEPPERDKRP